MSCSAADAACRRSVPFMAFGDSVRCESTAPPPGGWGENIADAVIDIGGVGEPKDRLRRRGESSGGANPLGLGENIADAVIATGEEASTDENGREVCPTEPAEAGGVGGERGRARGGGVSSVNISVETTIDVAEQATRPT